MPGWEPLLFRARNVSDVNPPALEKGWKSGFMTGYNNTTTQFAQFISIYPRENISRVFNMSELTENETRLHTRKYGEWTVAFLFTDEDNQTGMNLAFYNGEVYQTIYASGNNTADLEWFAQKAAQKMGLNVSDENQT
ncbi:Uncharacterised protein [uncultured archaeon]|nr:Uncharacterised protein [uncultured archaeon]